MSFTESDLLSQLYERFPEIREDLDAESLKGIYLEIASLMRKTQAAISDGDREFLTRAFSFADDAYRLGDQTIKNAIAVSFLEHLTFTDTKKRRRSWAFDMMSPCLQQNTAK